MMNNRCVRIALVAAILVVSFPIGGFIIAAATATVGTAASKIGGGQWVAGAVLLSALVVTSIAMARTIVDDLWPRDDD